MHLHRRFRVAIGTVATTGRTRLRWYAKYRQQESIWRQRYVEEDKERAEEKHRIEWYILRVPGRQQLWSRYLRPLLVDPSDRLRGKAHASYPEDAVGARDDLVLRGT
jgi:hypothetical protein